MSIINNTWRPIVQTITSYLNILEDDVTFQAPILHRFFAEMVEFSSETRGSRTYLNWTQQDSSTRFNIDKAFKAICDDWGSSAWRAFKGSTCYNMCHINENLLMKTLIQQAPSSRTNFYVIDPGAGDLSSNEGMADFINAQTDLRSDITVHIIGMIAEQSFSPKIVKSGKCLLYNLSQFKTEALIPELQRCGVSVKEGEVDIVRTRWSLRHFVDPVGTFVTLFNYLRPGGVFLGDGFFFLEQRDRSWTHYVYRNPNLNVINLLLNTGAPFLMEHNDGFRGLNDFLIKKLDDTSLQLDMRYQGCGSTDSDADVGSKCVMEFINNHPHRDFSEINFPSPKWSTGAWDLHGSRSLHSWLRTNGLINLKEQPWKPILKTEHLAIEAATKLSGVPTPVETTTKGSVVASPDESSESRLACPKEKGNITAIAKWLQMGDCVILHNGNEGFHFHQDLSNSLDQIRVICIEVNPDTGLLHEDEWPGFLTASGFKFATPEFLKQVENLDKVPNLYRFRFGYAKQ